MMSKSSGIPEKRASHEIRFSNSRGFEAREDEYHPVLLAIKYWLGAKIRDDDSRQTLSTFQLAIPTSTTKIA